MQIERTANDLFVHNVSYVTSSY